MEQPVDSNHGLIEALVGDGRPLLKLTGIALIGSGLFAFFLGATGHFLPHDIAFLGAASAELNSIAESRLVRFMIHDRVSFGGAILGVGILYLWLAEFPLRGQSVGLVALLVSGATGFASFLAYLGYGYLDSWHGIATLVLLPIYTVGMYKTIAILRPAQPFQSLFRADSRGGWTTTLRRVGWILLLATSLALVLGGLIIMRVGMTTVFVPQDLEFMHLCVADIDAINPRLIPLIAHDRAGFGGGVACCGLTMFFCVLHGFPSRSLWQALLIVGVAGFGSAIGVHYPIGYTSFTHLRTAYLGAVMFICGIVLTRPQSI